MDIAPVSPNIRALTIATKGITLEEIAARPQDFIKPTVTQGTVTKNYVREQIALTNETIASIHEHEKTMGDIYHPYLSILRQDLANYMRMLEHVPEAPGQFLELKA